MNQLSGEFVLKQVRKYISLSTSYAFSNSGLMKEFDNVDFYKTFLLRILFHRKKTILLLFCQSVAMSFNAFFLICGMCSLVRHCVFVCWSAIVSLYVYFYVYVYVCVSIHRCLSLFLCLSLYLSIICLPFGREHFSISL